MRLPVLMNIHFTPWDYLLIVAVSAQASLMAYLHHPKWKALMLSLPVPFTIAVLSVGRPIDATNVIGMLVLLLYTHAVRVLYRSLGVPIVAAIAVSVTGYCVLASALARVMPRTELSFWISCVAVAATAAVLLRLTAHRDEPGHRTSLPVWIKVPIVAAVIVGIVLIKQYLQGFMTMFPMVGLIAAYEARHCLWTICRQIPVVMLTMLPMMIVMHLAQPHTGFRLALIPGWLAMLAVLVPMTLRQWRRHYADEDEN
jgi:hypothetical protein